MVDDDDPAGAVHGKRHALHQPAAARLDARLFPGPQAPEPVGRLRGSGTGGDEPRLGGREEARRHSRRVKTGQQLLHVDPDVALVGDRHHAQVARVREADAYAGPLRGELGLAVAPELPTDPLGGYAQPGADDDPYGAVCDDEPAAVLRMQERFGTLALPVVEHGVQAREDRLRYLRTDQPHVHDVGTHRPPW
ncbi:MAG: hypothetical protein AUI14_07050 [Actinobacteria bacterium 13_2_20CM_2_71_6]|nr:MAG: hypothetical protein AUI14_07050 [Actinobacteria bacterium 13_2_20CM_2_71_6]